jgi:hypothetical protein
LPANAHHEIDVVADPGSTLDLDQLGGTRFNADGTLDYERMSLVQQEADSPATGFQIRVTSFSLGVATASLKRSLGEVTVRIIKRGVTKKSR